MRDLLAMVQIDDSLWDVSESQSRENQLQLKAEIEIQSHKEAQGHAHTFFFGVVFNVPPVNVRHRFLQLVRALYWNRHSLMASANSNIHVSQGETEPNWIEVRRPDTALISTLILVQQQ